MKERLRFCIFIISLGLIVFTARAQQSEVVSEFSQSLPDSAVFSRLRPEPAIARGFTFRDRMRQQDYHDARVWGANVVRLHLSPSRYASRAHMEFFEALPAYLDELEKQVQYAKAAGLKVVLDLHFPPFTDAKNIDYPEFWERDDLEEPFCSVWSEMAKRFLPYRDVIWGYDLLNEPLDRTQLPGVAKQWRPIAEKIIAAIRKVDKETWIIFEPGPGSLFNGFKGLEPFADPRIIYSAHFYYPQEFTHQGVENIEGTDLAKAMEEINLQYPSTEGRHPWNKERFEQILKSADEFQARWKVPIYVGEFSVIRWAPKESALLWLKDVVDLFEERGWSWSYHAFREFHGWSLEHDEKYWQQSMTRPEPVSYETERGKVIKSYLQRNKK